MRVPCVQFTIAGDFDRLSIEPVHISPQRVGGVLHCAPFGLFQVQIQPKIRPEIILKGWTRTPAVSWMWRWCEPSLKCIPTHELRATLATCVSWSLGWTESSRDHAASKFSYDSQNPAPHCTVAGSPVLGTISSKGGPRHPRSRRAGCTVLLQPPIFFCLPLQHCQLLFLPPVALQGDWS